MRTSRGLFALLTCGTGLLGLLVWFLFWVLEPGPRAASSPDAGSADGTAGGSSSLAPQRKATPIVPAPDPRRQRLDPRRPRTAPVAADPSRVIAPHTDWMTPVTRTFLTDHPDLAGMGELLRRLALRTVVDEEKIERRGRLTRAPLRLPESDLTGQFTLLNKFAMVEFTTPRSQPLIGHFVQRTVQVQFFFGPDGPLMPRLTVYYAPPDRRPAERALWQRFVATAGDETRRTGCNVFLTAAGGPKMTPLACRVVRAFGRSRISSASEQTHAIADRQMQPVAAPELTAFDLWHERLERFRQTP